MAETLEGEPDGVDEAHAGADEGVAQLQAQEIVLGLGGTVLDGMEQRGIHAGEAGEHLGIAAVALAFGAGDGVELARVGDEHLRAVFGEEAADPRTVRARFNGHSGAGKIREELRQGRAGVGQRRLTDNLTSGIKDADMMCPITEIQAEGEPTADGSGRWGNDGGSSFVFHKAVKLHPTQPLRRATAFSSNLVRRQTVKSHGINF